MHCGKFAKQSLTQFAAGNGLGQKLPMFIIRKASKPRRFKNLKHLSCHYRTKKVIVMDSDLFEDWVRKQDSKFESQIRKVLLIVDNFPAHPEMGDLKAIELCFLPLNPTSVTQPVDQGVIRSLKAKYHSRMIQQIIKPIDANKVYSKSEYIRCHVMLTICWEDVTEETVKKCFTKSRISPKDQANAQVD